MVVVQNKTQTSSSSSPLSIAPQSDAKESKSSLSFSELLRGITLPKDEKEAQKSPVVLSLVDTKEGQKTEVALKPQKAQTLNSLLKNKEQVKEQSIVAPTETPALKQDEKVSEKVLLTLNPQITEKMTPSELKVLINDAKQYLKDKIVQSEGFKKSEIQALPKTLKGLTQVAQKLGIDVSKISLQEVSVRLEKETSKTTTVVSKEISPKKQSDVKSQVAPQSVTAEATQESTLKSKTTQMQEVLNKQTPVEAPKTTQESISRVKLLRCKKYLTNKLQ